MLKAASQDDPYAYDDSVSDRKSEDDMWDIDLKEVQPLPDIPPPTIPPRPASIPIGYRPQLPVRRPSISPASSTQTSSTPSPLPTEQTLKRRRSSREGHYSTSSPTPTVPPLISSSTSSKTLTVKSSLRSSAVSNPSMDVEISTTGDEIYCRTQARALQAYWMKVSSLRPMTSKTELIRLAKSYDSAELKIGQLTFRQRELLITIFEFVVEKWRREGEDEAADDLAVELRRLLALRTPMIAPPRTITIELPPAEELDSSKVYTVRVKEEGVKSET